MGDYFKHITKDIANKTMVVLFVQIVSCTCVAIIMDDAFARYPTMPVQNPYAIMFKNYSQIRLSIHQ